MTGSALTEGSRQRGLEPQYIHADTAGRFPFDATLSDLARREGTAVARFDAKALEYPIAHLDLSGPGWPLWMLLRPLGLGLAGLLLAIGLDRWLSRRLADHRHRKLSNSGDPQSDAKRTHTEAVVSR